MGDTRDSSTAARLANLNDEKKFKKISGFNTERILKNPRRFLKVRGTGDARDSRGTSWPPIKPDQPNKAGSLSKFKESSRETRKQRGMPEIHEPQLGRQSKANRPNQSCPLFKTRSPRILHSKIKERKSETRFDFYLNQKKSEEAANQKRRGRHCPTAKVGAETKGNQIQKTKPSPSKKNVRNQSRSGRNASPETD